MTGEKATEAAALIRRSLSSCVLERSPFQHHFQLCQLPARHRLGELPAREAEAPVPVEADGALISLQHEQGHLLFRKKRQGAIQQRAAGSDEALRLVPPRIMSLEQCMEFLADYELLEVTPKSLRLRKRVLDHERRAKSTFRAKQNK